MTSPTKAAELAEKLTPFDYLLNAYTRAAQDPHPAKRGYSSKRKALLQHVRELEAKAAQVEALLRASEGRASEGHAIVNLWDLKLLAEMQEEDWPGQGAGAAELSEHWFKAFRRRLDKAKELHRAAAGSVTAAPHPPAQQAEPAWIDWSGGKCPVPDGTPVLVRYRNGCEAGPFPANMHLENRLDDAGPAYWKHDGAPNDITAYRCSPPPHKAEGAEPVVEQWGYSFCEERYSGPFDSREEAIAEARSGDSGGACFIAKVRHPVEFIQPEYIGFLLEERITEMLADEVGEACDGFDLDHEAIGQVVIDWIMAHGGFGCWGVKDIEQVDLTTQEPSA